MSLNQKSHKRIIFLASGSIGDALMMLALGGEILNYQPDARITLVTVKNTALIQDFASRYQNISVIPIRKKRAISLQGIYFLVQKASIIMVPVPFGGRFFNSVITKLIRYRPGSITAGLLKRAGDLDLYSVSAAYDSKLTYMDNIRVLARLVELKTKSLGELIDFSFASLQPDQMYIPESPYIVFHPFGSSSWKTFPPHRCHTLLEKLQNEFPRLGIVLTGGPENQEAARAIAAGLPNVRIAAGLPISELVWLIEHAKVYIGVDTGPTHIAGLLRKKSIVLGNNASPTWLPRYNPNAVILKNDAHCKCDGEKGGDCRIVEDGLPYFRCMYEIQDEEIVEAVRLP